MHLRESEEGTLLPGIRVEDMVSHQSVFSDCSFSYLSFAPNGCLQGMKTVANDLDNARVWFDHVKLPKSALLNKFCDIDDDNQYVQKGGEKMRIEVRRLQH